MKKYVLFILLLSVLSTAQTCYGLAEEQIGPDSADRPTITQPGWPKGIVDVPRHPSRVYSIWINGNENFYFKATPDDVNELVTLFSRARMRDHEVVIAAKQEQVKPFNGDPIDYNVSLQVVAGIALAIARDGKADDLTLEPRLTIFAGDNRALVRKVIWPKNLIIRSKIPGVSIPSGRTKPQRDAYYGRLEFADSSSPAESMQRINSRITLWEQQAEDGIDVGPVNNQGYFMVMLSKEEMANLQAGKMWLTVTIANLLAEAHKTDQRIPAERLTQDKDQAQPVQVKGPAYYNYFGRILFEDGSPPILDPVPWPGAEIRMTFPFAGRATIDLEGYFKVMFTKEQFEKASADKMTTNVYVPDYLEKGRSTAKAAFPVSLLSQDKAKAGVVKIPRPKLPKQELSTAELKIGKSIPGFNHIRFDVFQEEQAKNKPLLVCFWDIDQRPSRQCILMLEKQKGVLQDKNIVILAVYSGTKPEKEVRQWLKDNGLSLMFGMVEGDPYDTLLAWGAKGLPWLILTDEQHIVTNAGFSLADLSIMH